MDLATSTFPQETTSYLVEETTFSSVEEAISSLVEETIEASGDNSWLQIYRNVSLLPLACLYLIA